MNGYIGLKPTAAAQHIDTEKCIDVGAFFDRFGAAKMAVLTSAHVGVQALLKDAQVRKWIDLSRTELRDSLLYISSIVPELTTELIDAIIDTPVQLEENLALRVTYLGL